MNGSDRRQLRELISTMCDRPLTEEEAKSLNELILSDDQLAEEAANLLEVNAALTHPTAEVVALISESGSPATTELATAAVPTASLKYRSWLVLSLAATLLAVCTSWITWQLVATSNSASLAQQSPSQTDDENAEQSLDDPSKSEDYVARIVRKIDCDWEADRWAVLNSADLRADQNLSMNQGLMELEFSSGARVTLQGPASMTVVSPMSIILFRGRLTADVPESAHGFSVRTPSGQAIDLGTRFGLQVSDQGLTEAHVFEGEVIVRDALNADESADPIHLTENMAYKFGDAASASQLKAQPGRFIDLAITEEATVEPPALQEDLKLRLTADGTIQTDDRQRVSFWGHSDGENKTTLGAWQVRPQNRPKLVADVFGDKPGLHFNGRNYLVTDPLALPPDLTACVVFKFNANAIAKHQTTWPQGYQLLNFNGPSTMVLRMNKDLHLSGFMYEGVTRRDDGSEEHTKAGVTWSDRLEEKVPHLAVYVNDSKAGKARLYIDGTLCEETPCNVAKKTAVPRFIGSHNHMWRPRFVGHMAELLVYGRAASEQEVQTLSKSLMDKYQIAPPIRTASTTK